MTMRGRELGVEVTPGPPIVRGPGVSKHRQVDGHALVDQGAAFTSRGARVNPGTSGGPGRARCECGWLSERRPSQGARMAAHRGHKAHIVAGHSWQPSAAVGWVVCLGCGETREST